MSVRETLTPLIDDKKLRAVIGAVETYDLSKLKSPALAQFTISSMDTNPHSVFGLPGDKFQAVATVYVVFGPDDSNSEFTDGIPAFVRGHFDKGTAVVDDAVVDVEGLT